MKKVKLSSIWNNLPLAKGSTPGLIKVSVNPQQERKVYRLSEPAWYRIASVRGGDTGGSGILNLHKFYNTTPSGCAIIIPVVGYREGLLIEKVLNISTNLTKARIVHPKMEFSGDTYFEIYYNRSTANNFFVTLSTSYSLTLLENVEIGRIEEGYSSFEVVL